jgi:predicted transcriptional regulator of viral defense system
MKDNMLTEMLEKKYGKDEPIFYDDIIKLLENYSRAHICRLIKKAKEKQELVQFSRGVYYIPHTTFFGTKSTINVEDIVVRKYLKNKDNIGTYCGTKLLNMFSITNQNAMTVEIVTNNEATRCRKINLCGRNFIIHKSRIKINSNNFGSYTILQLFNDIDDQENIDDVSKNKILDFALNNNVTKNEIIEMSRLFPAKASKNIIRSGILNEIA